MGCGLVVDSDTTFSPSQCLPNTYNQIKFIVQAKMLQRGSKDQCLKQILFIRQIGLRPVQPNTQPTLFCLSQMVMCHVSKKLHVSNSSFKLIPYPYCRLAVLIVLAIIGEKILVQNPETFFPLFPFLLVFSENQFSNSCLAFLLLLFKQLF